MIYKHTSLHDNTYPATGCLTSLNTFAATANMILYQTFGKSPVNIVGIGTSGAILMTAIAFTSATNDKQNRNLVLIKKPNEDTHRSDFVAIKSYKPQYPTVIVDDHVATGDTLRNIVKFLKEHHHCETVELVIAKTFDTRLDSKPEFEGIKAVVSGSVTSNEYIEYYPHCITVLPKITKHEQPQTELAEVAFEE